MAANFIRGTRGRAFLVIALVLGLAVVGLSLNFLHNRSAGIGVTGRAGASLMTSDPTKDWAQASSVVEADVSQVGDAVWNTPTGTEPSLDQFRHEAYQYSTFTPLTIQITHAYKGANTAPTVYWINGGNPPGPSAVRSSFAGAEAQPKVGDHLVLFFGRSIDWRFGHGVPIRGHVTELCRVDAASIADCGSYSMPLTQLRQVLDRLS